MAIWLSVRNSLERMVKSGAISGAKADAWKQRLAEEEEITFVACASANAPEHATAGPEGEAENLP